MNTQSLLKGFEVELFTGHWTGENVGVSSEVADELQGFVTEPDQRNLEFITTPDSDYEALRHALLVPRKSLRQWLSPKGLTLLPGSTLSLGDSKHFKRSDPNNPYHELIENTYGTRVVTASVHINLGINDPILLFAALRLVRCEAALLLSLSASSPFLSGQITGFHSQRWRQFPITPADIPFFLSHRHFVEWTEQQLRNGEMWNERHLWTSVRPNGPKRPYELNRVELRICDLMTDPSTLLAVTALFELRVLNLINNPEKLDPIHASSLSTEELTKLSHLNDMAAAENSLDATLHHWKDGKPIQCRDWIKKLLEEVLPMANELNLNEQLMPLQGILEHGNQAMRWLRSIQEGQSLEEVFQAGIIAMANEEALDLNKKTKPFGMIEDHALDQLRRSADAPLP